MDNLHYTIEEKTDLLRKETTVGDIDCVRLAGILEDRTFAQIEEIANALVKVAVGKTG